MMLFVNWNLSADPEHKAFAGSDVAGIQTTATRTDGGWRLNGTKVSRPLPDLISTQLTQNLTLEMDNEWHVLRLFRCRM